MNFCTWSTDDFRCDVHVVQAPDGTYTTNVACARYETDCPRSVPVFEILEAQGNDRLAALDRFCTAALAQQEWAFSAPLVRIGGPHDGKIYHDLTLEGVLVRLTDLVRAGYRVPPQVFDKVRWQIGYEHETTRRAA